MDNARILAITGHIISIFYLTAIYTRYISAEPYLPIILSVASLYLRSIGNGLAHKSTTYLASSTAIASIYTVIALYILSNRWSISIYTQPAITQLSIAILLLISAYILLEAIQNLEKGNKVSYIIMMLAILNVAVFFTSIYTFLSTIGGERTIYELIMAVARINTYFNTALALSIVYDLLSAGNHIYKLLPTIKKTVYMPSRGEIKISISIPKQYIPALLDRIVEAGLEIDVRKRGVLVDKLYIPAEINLPRNTAISKIVLNSKEAIDMFRDYGELLLSSGKLEIYIYGSGATLVSRQENGEYISAEVNNPPKLHI